MHTNYYFLRQLAPALTERLRGYRVAVCFTQGPHAALEAMAELAQPLAKYHHFYATRADFRRRLGEDPRDDYQRALDLVTNDGERRFLQKQMIAT